MAVQRVVVPDTGDDEAGFKTCLGYAKAIIEAPGSAIARILLLVHTKQQLTNTDLPGYLGQAAAKTLANNGVIRFAGVEMRAATLKTLSSMQNGTLILAFWADGKMMNQIDALAGVGAIVAYPWPQDALDPWIATWNPHVHGQAKGPAEPLITDPIVEAALRGMTIVMNLSNTGLHSYYKDSADRMLRILRAKNHTIEPDKIRQWAVRNKWQPGAADDLAKLASKIAGLKTKPSLNSIDNGQGTYQHWQQSAQAAPATASND